MNLSQVVQVQRLLQRYHETLPTRDIEYHENCAEACKFAADWLIALRCRKAWGALITSEGIVSLWAWLDKDKEGVKVVEVKFDGEPSPNARAEALEILAQDREDWYERGIPCCE